MEVKRPATIALGILLVAIGFSVVVPAWRHVEFWVWCYRNAVPCPLFPLTYELVVLRFSTANYSTAETLLKLGLGTVVLGLALITLSTKKIYQTMSR